jgi:aminoglycoside phosphotransferase (APT) family kinase protein
LIDVLEEIVGAPVVLEELKHKPGRRRTLRARGSGGSAIVKQYTSNRATVVARRVAALAAGPPEPVVPAVLHVDPGLHLVVLSDVPGFPLREALLEGDLATCSRVGAMLGAWHAAWDGLAPAPLQPHTVNRELEILRSRAEAASPAVARAVADALPGLAQEWTCRTVVHRDLYEEQVLAGERVGVIDVDDAAVGPPELDVGNLAAHVELLERRRRRGFARELQAVLDGYAETGPLLDEALLDCCRRLTLLRLACLNDDAGLAASATAGNVPAPVR